MKTRGAVRSAAPSHPASKLPLPIVRSAHPHPFADYRVVKEFRMMRFNGERWEPFGPIVAD